MITTPNISPAEAERRSLLARYHLQHRRLPPQGQRDVATLRRLLGPETRAQASPLRAAPLSAHTIDFGLLTPMQRAALKRDNRQAYDASRKAWCDAHGFPVEHERVVRAGNRVMSRTGDTPQSAERFDAGGRRFEELRPVERAALARSDRAAYDRLRADWIARGEPAE